LKDTQFDAYRSYLDQLQRLGNDLNLSPRETEILKNIAADDRLRVLVMSPGGKGGARSIKLSNFEFNLGELAPVVSSILLALYGANDPQNPLLISGIILLAIGAVYKAASREISEQEATVFWGLISACSSGTRTKLKSVIKQTNTERAKAYLPALTKDQVLYSLDLLERMNTVAKVQSPKDIWEVSESYRLKKQ
jgi:hypothetical protein